MVSEPPHWFTYAAAAGIGESNRRSHSTTPNARSFWRSSPINPQRNIATQSSNKSIIRASRISPTATQSSRSSTTIPQRNPQDKETRISPAISTVVPQRKEGIDLPNEILNLKKTEQFSDSQSEEDEAVLRSSSSILNLTEQFSGPAKAVAYLYRKFVQRDSCSCVESSSAVFESAIELKLSINNEVFDDNSSAYLELQSDILQESSDLDFSDYSSSMCEKFCRSTYAPEDSSYPEEHNISDEISLELEEGDGESCRMLRSRERRQVYLLDLFWNLAFIFVSVSVLVMSRDESPMMPLRLWIVGYDFQCVLHIVCVCLEYRQRNQLPSSPENLNSRRSSGNWSGGNSSSGSDGESGDYGLDTRQNEDADETSTANTMFSFIWWIIGFYWVSAGGESRPGGEAIRRPKCSQNLEDFQFVDIVIEAIVESESVKKKFFVDLDKIVKSSAILTFNTSSISITCLASATNHPTQVIGMYFMNPPPIMKLVEIIRGADTSDETYNVTKNLAEKFGKTVLCSQDYAGFIVNRILMPMINEAFYTLYNGVAAKEDIDAGRKFGTNHPMGPLELADFIGLDVCLAILKVLHGSLGDTKYAPCPLLVLFVMCGSLGSALQLLAASPYSLLIEKVFVKLKKVESSLE